MISDGDKGAILQHDGRTYAVAPHLPCGVVDPQTLHKIADVADKYGAKLKCTGAQRIAIIGLQGQDVDSVWAELGSPRGGHSTQGHMIGNVVRSVKACPGTQFCKRAREDSLSVGIELDRRYHGRALPGKMKIGVSGCPNDCSETCIRDIGLIGGAKGWRMTVGGNGGTNPRLGKELIGGEVSTDHAMQLVDRAVEFFRIYARPDERLGDVILRVGIGAARKAITDPLSS